jgi:signal transduction histidine kinase
MQAVIYAFNGIIIFQLLFTMLQFLVTRQRYYLYYTLYLVLAFLYFTHIIFFPDAGIGIFNRHIKAELPQWLAILLYIAYGAFLINFLNLAVENKRVYGIIRFGQKAAFTYLLADMAFMLLAKIPIPSFIYWICATITFLVIAYAFFLLFSNRSKITTYILTGSFCALLFSFISTILLMISQTHGTEPGLFPFIISYSGVILEMVFFMTAFMLKNISTERQRLKAQQLANEQESRNKQLLIDMYEMRGKISADLHDQVGSTLYSVSLNSQMAIASLQSEHKEQAMDIMGKISASTQAMLGEMNDIVWAINPANDSFDKLTERMKQATRNLFQPLGIVPVFDFRFDGEIERLSMKKRKNLYLIYKEAITNAARHAALSRLLISGHTNGHTMQLHIENNGISFDPAQIKKGNGILNMQRRAEEMGGTLSIQSLPGGGTSLHLQVPLP